MDTTSGSSIDRTKIRAWQVCDEDIVAAETWDEAIRWHVKEYGSDVDENGDEPDEVPLTKTIWRDEEKTGRITLAQVIAECDSFPCVICSTEW
jgi:hypothetical protein